MTLFDLVASLKLDDSEYEAGLSESEQKAYNAGQSIGNGLKTVGSVAGKAITAGVAAATTGVVALTKSATEAYSEQQQLVGGIETLYKENASSMIQYANDAFKTAGMSANDYMTTAIESSAAMINSLDGDTAKAAEMTNMAIIDMSDNVNKMGTSMESIQNAYRGFSRGNFTMLDNLALGFSGTKEGMQELLDKAQELSGVEYDIGSYADIVEAIHVVQTEMGIAGTTAKEAGETVSGSAGSMKAAWQNLVASLASGENIEQNLDNLVSSVEGFAQNMLPVVEQSLTGIAELVGKLAPIIAEKLPVLMDEILPPLIEAVTALLQGLIEALPTILQVLIEALPTIIDTVVSTLVDLLPMIVELGLQLILALAEGLIEALPELIPAIVEVITQIVTLLTEPDTLLKLIEVAIQLIGALAEGILQAIPQLVAALPQIILNMVQFFMEAGPELIASGLELIMNLITGFLSAESEILDAVLEIKDTFSDKFHEMIDDAKQWGLDLITGFIDGIKEKWGELKDTVAGMAQTVKDYIGFSEPKLGPLSNFHTYAPDMMDLFIKGISDNEDRLQNQLSDTFRVDPMDSIDLSGSTATMPGVSTIDTSKLISTKSNNTQAAGSGTAILEIDHVQFAKLIYNLYNNEDQRMGVRLSNA